MKLTFRTDDFAQRVQYLQVGSFTNGDNPEGNTLLHLATMFGLPHELKELLEAPSYSSDRDDMHVNSTNNNGDTPLHVAAQRDSNYACLEVACAFAS